jgi:MarR family transcriptional regulator for hemolysin
LDVEPITLARLLDRMEAKGWIRRQPDLKDRRARLVFLTDKAKPLVEKLVEFAGEARAAAMAGLSPEEQEKLIDLMIRVRSNLAKGDVAGDAATQRRNGATETQDHDADTRDRRVATARRA